MAVDNSNLPDIPPNETEAERKKRLAQFKFKPDSDSEESDVDKYPEFLPNPESYEAIGKNLEVNLEDLKRRLKADFSDEITNLEFNVSRLEAELKKQQLAIEALQIENERLRQEKELLISKLEAEEDSVQPSEKETTIAQQESDEQYEARRQTIEESYAGGRNPTGIGGKPGSRFSTATIINQHVYQGDRIKLDDNSFLDWDAGVSQYKLSSANSGLKFTFFAVEAAYLEDGFINPNYPQFFSQTILRKQVWYERTPHNRISDGLGEKYGGRVPQEILRAELNSRVNTARVLADGSLQEEIDFEPAYKNWRYTYQVGTYYTDSEGELYTLLDVDERKSKGNAPAYRTDAKASSPTYGQRKPTSQREKDAWNSTLKGSGKKKDLFKRRKKDSL